MSDDDFPHLAEERRAHRRNVAFAITGVFLVITVFVLRLGLSAEQRRDAEMSHQLDRALDDYARTLPTPAAATPDRPPIELEVAIGTRRVDFDGQPIALGDGRMLELEARPTWTHVGADFSFRHPPTIRVQQGLTLLMSTRDASAELAIIDSDRGDAADLEEMAAPYTGTGQVTSTEATTHTLLGHKVTGSRLVAARLVIELMSARAGRHRRLRVAVTGTSADADLRPLIAAVETVTTKRAAPTPEFDAVLTDSSGAEVGREPATIGAPVKIGTDEIEITIKRRATVREQLAGMTFEHGPELSTLVLESAFPVVQLRSGELGIQLMAPPIAVSVDDVLSGISGGVAIQRQQEVTRTFGGTDYRGMAADMAIGTLAMRVEVFAFKRDGRDFVATLQYPVAEADTVVRLAGPVITSVR